MQWIKITPDSFTDLHIGDWVTKENSTEIANLMEAEPVDESSEDILHAYQISGVEREPEACITLAPAVRHSSGTDKLNVSIGELIASWWLLKKDNAQQANDIEL